MTARKRAAGPDVGLAELLAWRPLAAAPELLGAVLEVGSGPTRRSGRIVEVEAYEAENDAASHAYRGQTPRNGVMFGPAGHLYVYRSYGVHWCANIVCGRDGVAGAVLVRAVEPLDGIELMWPDRPKARAVTDLASGPGKLCAALGIHGGHDGVELLAADSPVRLLAAPTVDRAPVVDGPRIGITKAVERRWRFAAAGNPHVSRPRPPGFGQGNRPAPATG
ncbi:MAG: DNA-3-methyladenine glycosylase [Actinomycetota bacterium]